MVWLMSGRKADWPSTDPDGLAVRFTLKDPRPRPDEYMPVLEGAGLRLEPLREEHLEALCGIGLDPDISRFMPNKLTTREQMAGYIRDALAARASLSAIPFVTVLAPESQEPQVVGTTRFMSIDSRNRRMEIGATWIGKPWQRTRVNTEAKYLMLQFKTDSLNERSCAALLRIGAGLEGMLRERPVQ